MYGKKLGRDKNQRTALFKNLVQSLIISESIETTESKAKAIKGLVDTLISQAKSKNRALLSQFFTDKKIVEKLVTDLVPRLKERSSGYTSVVKLGKRLGDNALIVRMSLLLEDKKAVSPKRTSRTTRKIKSVKNEN